VNQLWTKRWRLKYLLKVYLRRVFAVTFVGICIVAAVCRFDNETKSTSEAVGTAIRAGGIVDLAKLTPFAWDEARVFSPYTLYSDICLSYYRIWPFCHRVFDVFVPESEELIVFSLGGKYVAHENHARRNASFCQQTCALVILKNQAKFRGERAIKTDDRWYQLVKVVDPQ
jgi:hypothetical protein